MSTKACSWCVMTTVKLMHEPVTASNVPGDPFGIVHVAFGWDAELEVKYGTATNSPITRTTIAKAESKTFLRFIPFFLNGCVSADIMCGCSRKIGI